MIKLLEKSRFLSIMIIITNGEKKFQIVSCPDKIDLSLI